MAHLFCDIENEIAVELLHELFEADFAAGKLFWRARLIADHRLKAWNKRFAGRIAGRLNTAGHRQIIITLNGRRFHTTAHRVLWAMREGKWPPSPLVIDHVRGTKDDNRQGEIRLATNGQNARNRGLHKNNTSGFKGVSWIRKLERWFVGLQVDKRFVKVGYFDDAREAARAYDAAAIKHHGEFARTNAMMGLL